MGLPKNYQSQKNQINKRFDSLNELNFYKVKYEFRFTKTFRESKQLEPWQIDNEWGIPLDTDINSKYRKIKKFSALDDEKANKKMVEWLDKQVENNIISEYDIISIEKESFEEVLEEKGLLPFVNTEK